MKLEEYLQTLPSSILSGNEVQLPDHSFREIFEFVNLSKDDVFYHLGCGNGRGLSISLEEFRVRKSVGIDNDAKKIEQAQKLLNEKNLHSFELNCIDVTDAKLDDATVILFWFADSKIIEKMMNKFEKLKECKVITIWGPLPGCLPDKVDFPYIINKIPFSPANDLKEQLLAVFGAKCVDFVNAWEFAERYTKAIGTPEAGNDRFLTILQSLVIWINAKNLGVACTEEIPPAIKNYIGILRNFFNIEVEHLLNEK